MAHNFLGFFNINKRINPTAPKIINISPMLAINNPITAPPIHILY